MTNCLFTEPNLQILGLHVENDHHGHQFECSDCSQKFPFKNKLKLHKRQMHEEETFACFVCNKKFQTHSKLKEHMQKKCKDNSPNIQPIPAGREDRAADQRLRCNMCVIMSDTQTLLLEHLKQKHQAMKNVCDVCNDEFETREALVLHIANTHARESHIINRHVCVICNVEVHGDETKENLVCRTPQYQCNGCKVKLFSKEAHFNHICPLHPNKSVDQQVRELNRRYTLCRWGETCYRQRKGICGFKHPITLTSNPQEVQGYENAWRFQGRRGSEGGQQQAARQEGGVQQGAQQEGGRQREGGHPGGRQQGGVQPGGGGQGGGAGTRPIFWCKFQDRCTRSETYKFQHHDQGFLQRPKGQIQQ